ncbi:MAG: hypothetical protein ACLTDM_04335 [Clostridium butyricum]
MTVKSNKKNKKHGKLIKCDNPECKKVLDFDEERELGNVEVERGITILYCNCGNQIIVK